MDSSTIITLPLSPQVGYPLLIAVALAVLSLAIYFVLSLQGRKPIRHIDDLGAGWAALLVPLAGVWLALFGLTVAAVFNSTYAMLNDPSQGGIGLGALIAALLGGPFLIWTTILKHRALGFQKEGHLTDRISKAVEQLGAEKTVDRIGRPVTVFSGKPTTLMHLVPERKEFDLPVRSKVLSEHWDQTYLEQQKDVFDGLHLEVKTWPEQRTVVEWQGEALRLSENEEIGSEGDWQVFSETVPNIEVRIGGILSLERIAQDSTAYDHGRDHVRVMEILCAYVRENAKAKDLEPTQPPFKMNTPRIDIQMAMNVIKNRSDVQVALEAAQRYRLDLRNTDLDGCDMSNGKFAGAIFWRSRLEAANLNKCDLTGTQMQGTLLNFAKFWDAKLWGTNLDHSIVSLPVNGGFNPNFTVGNVIGVSVVGADLRAIEYLGRSASKIFGSKDTRLSDDLEDQRDQLRQLRDQRRKAQRDKDEELRTETQSQIEDSPLGHWFEFDSDDLALGHFRQEFYDRLGITGWPHQD